MPVSAKCQYAVRATFELAKRYGTGPTKISVIAAAQAIPLRFLEGILNELKQAGFVSSLRGKEGGYSLLRPPDALKVGEVVRFVEGSLAPVECTDPNAPDTCPLAGDCVFLPMWQDAQDAVNEVYDSLTFTDLIERERQMRGDRAAEYVI
ncbi:MAG TPA: Rrf2 family transcriptional regulator [Armatimonadota bacterium]|jgi:Rrf2 family protein